jgi:uncharacterized protein with HEPN domain
MCWLSTGLREANPDVPWRSFVGIRDVLIHQYFGIDLDPVWIAATHDLPHLREAISQILSGLGED